MRDNEGKKEAAPVFEMNAPSQHVYGLFAAVRGVLALRPPELSPATGALACTPTAVIIAHRFLSLAQAGVLSEAPDEDFCRGLLSEGVRRGVELNRRLQQTYSRKNVKDVLKYLEEYNDASHSASAERNPFQELAELCAGESKTATTNPNFLGGADTSEIMFDVVLEGMLNNTSSNSAAIIATCSGHTTTILRIAERYYHIDSSISNKFQSSLKAFDDVLSLKNSLLKIWGESSEEIDLTQLSLKTVAPEPVLELR